MSDSGIKAWNENKEIQIDSLYRNLSLTGGDDRDIDADDESQYYGQGTTWNIPPQSEGVIPAKTDPLIPFDYTYQEYRTGDIYKLYDAAGDFVALGQTYGNWRAMATLGSDVYAAIFGGDIYKQTNGTGDFDALSQTSRAWSAMATLGSDVYAAVLGGDIYKQTNGTGDFVALSQTSRYWYGMAALGNDMYAADSGGDIYKQTNGTGDFVALSQTSRSWRGMAALGDDMYAAVWNGDIYKQTNGTGDFVALSQTSRYWYSMAALGDDMYVSVVSGDVYKQTNGTGNFVAIGQLSKNWRGGMAALGDDLYAAASSGNVEIQEYDYTMTGPPLILWKPSSTAYTRFHKLYRSGTPEKNAGFRLLAEMGKEQTISWRLYQQSKGQQTENYGLQVYNSEGSLCFDGQLNYLKIHSVHTIDLDAPGYSSGDTEYEDIVHTDVSNPYYLIQFDDQVPFCIIQWPPTPTSGIITHKTIGLKKLSATSVRVGWFDFAIWDYPYEVKSQATYMQTNATATVLVCHP